MRFVIWSWPKRLESAMGSKSKMRINLAKAIQIKVPAQINRARIKNSNPLNQLWRHWESIQYAVITKSYANCSLKNLRTGTCKTLWLLLLSILQNISLETAINRAQRSFATALSSAWDVFLNQLPGRDHLIWSNGWTPVWKASVSSTH